VLELLFKNSFRKDAVIKAQRAVANTG